MPSPTEAAATPPATPPADQTVQTPAAAAPSPAPAAPGRRASIADQYNFDASQGEDFPAEAPAVVQAGVVRQAVHINPAPAAQPAAPATPQSRHKPRLASYARDNFGLSDATIELMTPDALEEAVLDHSTQQRVADRQARRDDRVQGVLDQRIPAGNHPAQAPEVITPAASGQDTLARPQPAVNSAPAADPFNLGQLEGKFDPELLGAIRRVGESAAARIAALEQQLGQYQQRDLQREQLSLSQRADRFFAGRKDHFGDQPGHAMQQGDTLYQRRLAVLGLVDRDGSHRSLEEKLTRAADALFGSGAGTPPPSTPAGQPPAAPNPQLPTAQDWQSAGLARPTQRSGADEPKGDQKALQTAARMMREKGLTDEGGTSEEDFPA